jgi:ferredoxin-NADP reductase
VSGMPWRYAVVLGREQETATAATIRLHVEGQPAATAGQRVEVRLTAEDGYTADREYSLARTGEADRAEITVQAIEDGEVSPFLVDDLEVGVELEVRGPIGGWFVWRPEQTEPVLLVAGGSGIVPLMAMVRARRAAGSRAPFRLVY